MSLVKAMGDKHDERKGNKNKAYSLDYVRSHATSVITETINLAGLLSCGFIR